MTTEQKTISLLLALATAVENLAREVDRPGSVIRLPGCDLTYETNAIRQGAARLLEEVRNAQ